MLIEVKIDPAALFTAAEACGLNADDGEEATRKTLESGLNNGEKHPHPDLDTGQQEGFIEPPATRASWKYYTGAAPAPLRWLIKGILPEIGAVLVAGQWGTFKTTVALDLSVCVMADLPFAGQRRVKRRGAVLYIALEGEGMLPARLRRCNLRCNLLDQAVSPDPVAKADMPGRARSSSKNERYAVTRRAGGIMELDKLGSAESFAITVSRPPENKLSVRSVP